MEGQCQEGRGDLDISKISRSGIVLLWQEVEMMDIIAWQSIISLAVNC